MEIAQGEMVVVGLLGKALTQGETRPVSHTASLSSKDSVKSQSLVEGQNDL